MDRRRLKRIAVVSTVSFALVFGTYYGVLAASDFTVAASSPDNGGGMTLAVAVPKYGLRATDGEASYYVKYNGQIIYPPGGKGAKFPISNGRGSLFVPYNLFVVGNGEYEIAVSFNGEVEKTTTRIHKWVNYVFLVPVEKRGSVHLEMFFSDLAGGAPGNSILAAGDLTVDVRYRGVDGELNAFAHRMNVKVDGNSPLLRFTVPKSAFARGEGYYSFDARFANDHALGNNGARTDPTLTATNPPRNWIYYEG